MESASPRAVIVFPARPGTREIDASFQAEQEAATAAGFATALVDEGELTFGGAARFVGLPEGPGLAVYRGWLLRTADYRRMAEGIAARGRTLLTSPEEYQRAYHLPEWYSAVLDTGLTPRSIWIPGVEFDVATVAEQVHATFGRSAVILKDYVKSRKHEWFEACFIPDAADREAVGRVVSRFLELQEDFLVGGLVFREFWPTKTIGLHPKSRAPLANEHRLFVVSGAIIDAMPYWGFAEYDAARPDPAFVAPILARNISPFYAVDIAERADGGWFVVELNDGGAAGLSRPELAGELYRALATALAQ